MRFLKRKINLKKDFLDEEDYDSSNEFDTKVESTASETNISEISNVPCFLEYALPTRKPRKHPTSPEGNSKNIVKNYGKALCAFASSALAVPYLESIIAKHSYAFISIKAFMDYINEKKSNMNNIVSLRRLLVQENGDSRELMAYKHVFQQISIVFLKYFSVNWIFNGKIVQKKAHLKFRFKMLRRISDPEHFTYLKTTL